MESDSFNDAGQASDALVDRQSELAAIGAILFAPQKLEELRFLEPEDFYYKAHQEIWRRILQSWEPGELLCPILLAEGENDLRQVLTDAELTGAIGIHAAGYGARVKELADRRRLVALAGFAARLAYSDAPPQTIRDQVQSLLDSSRIAGGEGEGWTVYGADCLAEPPEAREWFIDGLLYRGQLSLWYGAPGIKKSLLIADLCASLAMGAVWLPNQKRTGATGREASFPTCKPLRVLWSDWDNGGYETQIRLRAALRGRGWDGVAEAGLYYMSEGTPWLALDNAGHVRRLIRACQQFQVDVLVIDALGLVLGEVDENAPDVSVVLSKLKEIRNQTGAAVIVVHHPSKAGARSAGADTFNAAGHSKFSNFFEWTLEMRRGQEEDEVVVAVSKARGWAKTHKFGAKFEYSHFDPDRLPHLSHELESFRFVASGAQTQRDLEESRIFECATAILPRDGAMNQDQLVAAVQTRLADPALTSPPVKMGEKKIRTTLRQGAAQHGLECVQEGDRQPVLYSLPPAEPDHV